jgi:hypothetical protein
LRANVEHRRARSADQSLAKEITMRRARNFGVLVLVAAAAVTANAVPALAGATVLRGTTEEPIGDTGLTDECRPGITGELSGIEVTSFHSVETANGSHVAGTTTDTGRIDWSDGSYTIINSVDHFAFNTGPHTTVRPLAHKDSGDTYSPSGAFLFRLTFHSVERFTVTGGVPHAEFERGHVHVFGDC